MNLPARKNARKSKSEWFRRNCRNALRGAELRISINFGDVKQLPLVRE
jgi:hypothetical protein